MKKYANKKNLVAAIRRMEKTEPATPMKGRGNERVPTSDGEMIAAIVGQNITECSHVCRVFARRSNTAIYNKLQWGGDQDFVSPELAKLLGANTDLVTALRDDFAGHQNWNNSVA
jgi:hypothetical protein